MASDGRHENAGRPDGLGAKIEAAKATAPDGRAESLTVLSVGYTAYQRGCDPADVWQEVEADV